MSTLLRRAFADICNGYSKTYWQNKPVYIKHLTHRDHLDIDDKQLAHENEAKKAGLPTETEKIESLKKNGLWTDAKDKAIRDQQIFISRFEEARKKAVLPSVVKQYDGQINTEKDKLNKLLSEKEDLIGLTAEKHAQKLTNDYYIIKNLYVDSAMSSPLFNFETFDDISDSEISFLISLYNEAIEPCSERNIKLLSIQDFFQSYFFLCAEDLHSFYGRPIVNLTFYQIKLGNFARHFKNIFENHDISKLPEDARKDPDRIEQYINAAKEGNNLLDKTKGENASLVGATSEDLKSLGLDRQTIKFPNRAMNKDEMINFLSKGGK